MNKSGAFLDRLATTGFSRKALLDMQLLFFIIIIIIIIIIITYHKKTFNIPEPNINTNDIYVLVHTVFV